MKLKTCNKCGWSIPATNTMRCCPVCKTPFTQGLCSACGKYTEDLLGGSYCRVCHNAKSLKGNIKCAANRKAIRTKTYERWLAKVQQVPKRYPTLTEAQWLEACQNFNGCAFCNSEDVSARAYFVDFAAGGRYCNWNVVPVCEKCAMLVKQQRNPFERLAGRSIYTTPILDRIVEYLESKLDEAIKYNGDGANAKQNK